MARAIELARRSMGHTRPNPAVGAVVVKGGTIIGEGRHKRCGRDHAEAAALKDAAKRHGAKALKGATVYCTLEPCSRPGRVGACCDALIAAGVRRVVWACEDPNPVNRGKAAKVLGKAGIATAHGLLEKEAQELILGFSKYILTDLPYITVKLAMSLDGRICDVEGGSRWVSSVNSHKLTGRFRETCDAIMVGAETIRRDNPSLLSHGKRNDDLLRIVVTRSGRLPLDAQVFADDACGRTVVLVLGKKSAPKQLRALVAEKRCLAVFAVPSAKLSDALRFMCQYTKLMHILCEGGLELARSLADEGLVDEWLTVLAPKVIGNRPISKALKGGIVEESSGIAFGDAYVNVRFHP